ncbi:MAG: Rha family transcriptional regulator [Shewanella sp.]
MSDLVMIENGKAFAMSHEVADKFGKEHRTIYRKVEDLISSQPEFGNANFGITSYVTGQNKTHSCFQMTRDGFAMIAMSLTGREAEAWKIKYINAFNMMESALIGTAPTLETVNQIVKRAESDKQIASDCGSQLAKYKRVKKKNEDDLSVAMKSVQMALGFK